MRFFLIKTFLLVGVLAHAQQAIKGMVMEANSENKHIPLSGANIYWQGSAIGTITNEDGIFTLPYDSKYDQLIISYIGFKSDTLVIKSPRMIHHFLSSENELDEVVVTKEREALQKTFLTSQNMVTISSAELLKAACCNLSESFETNPAIDVNFNDALTGTKTIQMLGLTSPYILIAEENIPMVRGASQVYGLTFTPGTWVESIQLTKGAGSVINGFESISGQINTELVKPLTDQPLFVNAYANLNGRLELNTHWNKKLNNKCATGIYLHGNARTVAVDNNDDGFLDVPLANQINIMNRWQFQDAENGWVGFLNLRFLNDEKQIGQLDFEPNRDRNSNEVWGGEIKTQRFDVALKTGYVFPELPFQSFGFQAAVSSHDQESYFGQNRYDILHTSFYANALFNSIIGSTQHKFKTGVSTTYDQYEEQVITTGFAREDISAGVFFEYNYDNLENLNLTAGLRADTHNRLGNFLTPRVHLRYTPWERASLRGSFGIGRRVPNIFAENQQFFASSRLLNVAPNGGSVYGLQPEKATNFGLSFLQGFSLGNRIGNISVDFYRTDFEQQVVVDWENPREIAFYNLDGDSYANSLQIELNYEILPRLEMRAAYKDYEVETDYRSGRLQKPLVARDRWFFNLGYESMEKESGAQWRFDFTTHTIGMQRLPTSLSNDSYALPDEVEGYSLLNAQITKVFSKNFELYIGAENLTAERQPNPILGAENPFGASFDTSVVYAPILGRMIYTGLRWKVNSSE